MTPEELARAEAQQLERQGQLFRPFTASATSPDLSPPVPTGISLIDQPLGGGFRNGLHIIAGYSHNGKTQMLLRLLWENRDRPAILFTPDEENESVMYKLIAMAIGVPIEESSLWSASKKIGIVKEYWPKLVVDDEHRSKYDMVTIINEAQDYYGEEMCLAAYDYLEYFGSSRGTDAVHDMNRKATQMKLLAKDTRLPWVVLHQANRGNAQGQTMRATSLAYGGNAQATTVLGMRMQVFKPNMTQRERSQEERCPTVHINLIKNKQTYNYFKDRFGGGTPEYEIQFAIDKETGMIREMTSSDRVYGSLREVAGQVAGYG